MLLPRSSREYQLSRSRMNQPITNHCDSMSSGWKFISHIPLFCSFLNFFFEIETTFNNSLKIKYVHWLLCNQNKILFYFLAHNHTLQINMKNFTWLFFFWVLSISMGQCQGYYYTNYSNTNTKLSRYGVSTFSFKTTRDNWSSRLKLSNSDLTE